MLLLKILHCLLRALTPVLAAAALPPLPLIHPASRGRRHRRGWRASHPAAKLLANPSAPRSEHRRAAGRRATHTRRRAAHRHAGRRHGRFGRADGAGSRHRRRRHWGRAGRRGHRLLAADDHVDGCLALGAPAVRAVHPAALGAIVQRIARIITIAELGHFIRGGTGLVIRPRPVILGRQVSRSASLLTDRAAALPPDPATLGAALAVLGQRVDDLVLVRDVLRSFLWRAPGPNQIARDPAARLSAGAAHMRRLRSAARPETGGV